MTRAGTPKPFLPVIPPWATAVSTVILVAGFQVIGLTGGYEDSWLVVGTFAFLSICVVVTFEYWRLWLIWTPIPKRRSFGLVIEVFLVLGMLVTFFAYLMTLGYQEGWLEVSGVRGKRAAFEAADAACVWHFLDSVPALKIPETLNWEKLRHPYTDHISGGLLLAFKLIAVLPVISLVAELIGRARGTRTSPSG